jgi:hypothetical protein
MQGCESGKRRPSERGGWAAMVLRNHLPQPGAVADKASSTRCRIVSTMMIDIAA